MRHRHRASMAGGESSPVRLLPCGVSEGVHEVVLVVVVRLVGWSLVAGFVATSRAPRCHGWRAGRREGEKDGEEEAAAGPVRSGGPKKKRGEGERGESERTCSWAAWAERREVRGSRPVLTIFVFSFSKNVK
jgi:hypothetical protein